MTMRRIKFVWGGPEVIKGRWYFRLIGFYGRTEGAHDDGLAINVRGLLPWLLGAIMAAWLLGAAALFWVWQRNPHSVLTYSDAVFFPARRAEIQDKNGQVLIARGTAAWHAQRWSEAVACWRQGLALHPCDSVARLSFAQFYVATNQRPVAMRVLQEGLTDAFPGRGYLTGLFDIAEQAEDFGVVVQTAERYRPALQDAADRFDRRWLVAREFSARMGARQFAEALALAEAQEPGDLASEQRVLALLALQRTDEAVRGLAEWRVRPGADVTVVSRLAVRAFREAQQFENMERALDEMRRQAPADPQPQVYAVVQQAMTEREAPARAALEDYLFRFGGSPQNLQLIAEPLAEIAHLPLLDRCAAAAGERGYARSPYQLLLVQARMKRGEWEAAARTLAEMKPLSESPASPEQLWRDWMRRLLDAVRAPSEAASLSLADFLRNRPWSVKIFQTTVGALRRANQLETARDVLGLARARFPASAWAETHGLEVALEIAARPVAPTEPTTAKRKLPVQRLFFQRLDELLSDEEWTAAEQLIRDARSAQPEPCWLGSRDGELRLAELQVARANGERSMMLASAKLYLNGDTGRSRQASEVARKFFHKGDNGAAIALVKEVVRMSPDYAQARSQLSEWLPAPKGKK